MRPGVIAWGAVIVLIGAWALLASFGSGISGELALIVLFGGAGLTLIVSAAVAAVGRPKR
jgi:hypothetical protein